MKDTYNTIKGMVNAMELSCNYFSSVGYTVNEYDIEIVNDSMESFDDSIVDYSTCEESGHDPIIKAYTNVTFNNGAKTSQFIVGDFKDFRATHFTYDSDKEYKERQILGLNYKGEYIE